LSNLASTFGIGEALSDYVRGNVLESGSTMSQFPQEESEHLTLRLQTISLQHLRDEPS
jgi:hypothetical protein